MDLKKELLEFLEANNNFGIEEPEKVVDIYIEVYKEGKAINYFKKHELNKSEKLTAVEWLVDQMRQLKEQKQTLSTFVTLSFYDLEMFAEKAKEMEVQQSNDKIQNAIELFEQVKIQADTDKDVTYLDNVLAVLYGIKNNL